MITASLTARQEEILNLIKTNIRATGYPPTRAEIANELGFKSPNAAEEHLRALARKGVIEMIKGTSRGIRLLDEEQNGLPLVGRVAAGEAILAIENIEDYIDVTPDMFYPKADFFLKVQGASMQNIGIMDGDLLAVHKTNIAENGEIVTISLTFYLNKRILYPLLLSLILRIYLTNIMFNYLLMRYSQQKITKSDQTIALFTSVLQN